MIKHWTADEEEILWDLKSKGVRLAEIAETLGRTLESVRTRSKRLNAQKGVKSKTGGNFSWTPTQIEMLYEDLDFNELENLLPGKTRRAIMSKCEKLGISKRFPGCSKSAGTMNPNNPTTLYLVDFGEFKKVGVCQVPLEERFKQDGEYVVLDRIDNLDMQDALEFEQAILKFVRPYRVQGDLRRGGSECFNYTCTLLEELT